MSSGPNVKAVWQMLGHASAATILDVYADPFDDDLEAPADKPDQAARDSAMDDRWVQVAG